MNYKQPIEKFETQPNSIKGMAMSASLVKAQFVESINGIEFASLAVYLIIHDSDVVTLINAVRKSFRGQYK